MKSKAEGSHPHHSQVMRSGGDLSLHKLMGGAVVVVGLTGGLLDELIGTCLTFVCFLVLLYSLISVKRDG